MSCKTTNFVDPRIEPQPDPVYTRVVGPRQNQFYKLNPSSLSNSSVTFNNLTTLGVDRAYLDTFELEITAQIVFYNDGDATTNKGKLYSPYPDEWTFDSFPFAKSCEQARININGGAFFSSPLAYVRAKERYWCEKQLSECYENLCPVHKPHLQNELGMNLGDTTTTFSSADLLRTLNDYSFTEDTADKGEGTVNVVTGVQTGDAIPTRLPYAQKCYMQTPGGLSGTNNSIIHLGPQRTDSWAVAGVDFQNYYWPTSWGGKTVTKGTVLVVNVTWREPVFCSPFSSRIDATYGRPLYNITSMDLQFNMAPDLGNMIRLAHIHSPGTVSNYTISLTACQLCYQVMTIPTSVVKPPSTLVPYRRFVPYITDIPKDTTYTPGSVFKVRSGVYTWNEIPQAIWIFCAPSKAIVETNSEDKAGLTSSADNILNGHNWVTNKAFAYLTSVDITLANTTQILATAKREDLYRIAKANGCCDSYEAWTIPDVLNQRVYTTTTSEGITTVKPKNKPQGIGSVLRLIPGIDIILPDQDLIPAANANNMVLQVEANFIMPQVQAQQYSLWLLFEYNGVASISPGQCEITMNPLGSGAVFATSPTVSVSGEATDGQLEGSGVWDWIKRKLAWFHNRAKESGLYSAAANAIDNPYAKQVLQQANNLGFSSPPSKRSRGEPAPGPNGGAVMGLGDFT